MDGTAKAVIFVTLALVGVNLFLTYKVASGLQNVSNLAGSATGLLQGLGL